MSPLCDSSWAVRIPVGARPSVRRGRLVTVALTLVLVACDGSITEPDPGGRVEPVGRPAVVRGIYVNAQAAGSGAHLQSLIDLADGSALNTFVIDVKERGEVSWDSSVELVARIGAGRTYVPDRSALLRTLREHGIYPIARLVVFRDPILAEARPGWAIRTADGGVWLDPESGRPWVDPYHPEVWAYNLDLAREALAAGFAEVQWDYVRFPDVPDSVRETMVFPARAGRSAGEAIRGFIDTSRLELADFGAPITADVFGRVITLEDDSGIGQDWDDIVQVTDVVLPMVYPALYWPGNFDLPDPNAEPYLTVRAAMDSAVVRLARTPHARATIRPWLQAFTQGSTAYGPRQMLDQIRAVEDAGLQEWLFWNPGSTYPEGVF
jgi:hypothetical protein